MSVAAATFHGSDNVAADTVAVMWRRAVGGVRKVAVFLLALALAWGAWELYKAVGPEEGGSVFGWDLLPKTGDKVMPHIHSIIGRLFEAESRTSDRMLLRAVLDASWYSFQLVLLAFAIGALVGVGLAVLMSRFDIFRRASLPYLIASQTVPLIALAPIVIGWSARLKPFGWELPRWLAIVLLGAFLAFFPIAIGTLRGLQATPPAAAELMRSYAASWLKTVRSLQLPAAVPYMVPAFRLGASASVVGVVVSEISIGNAKGVGRMIINFSQQATTDPEKVFTAVLGACALGLAMAAVVAAGDGLLMRNRTRPEDGQ